MKQILDSVKSFYSANYLSIKADIKAKTTADDDTLRIKGHLLYNKTNNKTSYILESNYHRVFIKNDKTFGFNDNIKHSFIPLSQADTSKLLQNWIEKDCFLPFLVDSTFFTTRYLTQNPGCEVIIKQDSENYVIHMKDSISEVQDYLAEVKYYIEEIFISKKKYSIQKQIKILTYIMGGMEIVQYDEAKYTQDFNATKNDVINKINSYPTNDLNPNAVDHLELSTEIEEFPSFKAKNLLDQNFHSDKITSRFVLVEFWFKNCAPCIINLTQLEEVRKHFNPKDLTIIAIDDVDKNVQKIGEFLSQKKFSYTFLYDCPELSEKLKIREHPASYIYDNTTKKVILVHKGGGDGYGQFIIKSLEPYLLN